MTNDEKISILCAGNQDAARFCWSVLRWLHAIDAAWDDDKDFTTEEFVRIQIEAMAVFAENPFFQTYKEGLAALLTQSFNYWQLSEDPVWLSEDTNRIAALTLKSFYHSILWHVATLIGGFDHARQCMREFEGFQIYDLPTATAAGERAGPGNAS